MKRPGVAEVQRPCRLSPQCLQEPVPGAASTPPPPPPRRRTREAVPLLGGALERQIRGIPGLDVES